MIDFFVFAAFLTFLVIFAAEVLILGGNKEYNTYAAVAQSLGTLFSFFILPAFYLSASRDTAYNEKKWSSRRIVFLALSWIMYTFCLCLAVSIGLGWWKLLSDENLGSFVVLGSFVLIASVLMASSLSEAQIQLAIGNLTAKMQNMRLFLTMNILLTLVASFFAIVAELSYVSKGNKSVAMLEGLASLSLFMTVIFNTYGLGGRILHYNEDSYGQNGSTSASRSSDWSFWQPFLGGAKFIVFQIFSWVFFGVSLLLEILFVLSTFMIGVKIFVGVAAVAGLCCIISEALMIASLYSYRRREHRYAAFKQLSTALTEKPQQTQPRQVFSRQSSVEMSFHETSSKMDVKRGLTSVATYSRIELAASSLGSGQQPHSSSSSSPLDGVTPTDSRSDAALEAQQAAHDMQSALQYHKLLRHTVHRLHSLVVTTFVANMQNLPFVGMFPMFVLSGLPLREAFFHWLGACVCIGLYTIAFAYFKAREFNKRRKHHHITKTLQLPSSGSSLTSKSFAPSDNFNRVATSTTAGSQSDFLAALKQAPEVPSIPGCDFTSVLQPSVGNHEGHTCAPSAHISGKAESSSSSCAHQQTTTPPIPSTACSSSVPTAIYKQGGQGKRNRLSSEDAGGASCIHPDCNDNFKSELLQQHCDGEGKYFPTARHFYNLDKDGPHHCDEVHSKDGQLTYSSAHHHHGIGVGQDFHPIYNAVLFVIVCLPAVVTVILSRYTQFYDTTTHAYMTFFSFTEVLWPGYSIVSGKICQTATAGSLDLRDSRDKTSDLLRYALGPWIAITLAHFLYVGLTYRGAPEITGCREYARLRRDSPVVHHIGETVRKYFNGRVIKEADLDPDALYVMGFHPHGVVPITLFWLRCCEQWDALFPGVTFSALTASALHLVPLMRDFCQWMGGREVSRESFRLALRSGRNCMVVPGGQAEMLHSKSRGDDIHIVTKHNGFIRMAIEEGAQLVPVLSFGEVDIFDNIQAPSIQRWFLKRLGVALPHQPYGMFYLPIPRPTKVTVVVGKPIPVIRNPHPTDQQVQHLFDVYLLALLNIFDRYKLLAGERPSRRLLFTDGDGHPHRFTDTVDSILRESMSSSTVWSRSTSWSNVTDSAKVTWTEVQPGRVGEREDEEDDESGWKEREEQDDTWAEVESQYDSSGEDSDDFD